MREIVRAETMPGQEGEGRPTSPEHLGVVGSLRMLSGISLPSGWVEITRRRGRLAQFDVIYAPRTSQVGVSSLHPPGRVPGRDREEWP